MLKVFLLNVTWMMLCFIGTLLTPIYCLATGSTSTRKWSHVHIERKVGQMCCRLFIAPVEVRGAENLNEESLYQSPAPIFVANHDSQIDLAAVYALNQEWRWIAKSSVMFLPGVGQVMWLSGHVFIDRVKKATQKAKTSSTGARNLYIQSNASVQGGVPMFFFPQGTRRLGERLPFKDGAFKIALENNSKMIPISLEIPLTAWNSAYPFSSQVPPIVLTVHPPIDSKGKEIEVLKKECFDTIYSVLPDYTKQS